MHQQISMPAGACKQSYLQEISEGHCEGQAKPCETALETSLGLCMEVDKEIWQGKKSQELPPHVVLLMRTG